MNATKNSHLQNIAGCNKVTRNLKEKEGKALAIQTSFDGEQTDNSKCRTRMNDAGLAECAMEMRCPWALRVGHSVGLVIQTLTVCRHPSAKKMAATASEGAESASSRKTSKHKKP